jgi:hypothetical protein
MWLHYLAANLGRNRGAEPAVEEGLDKVGWKRLPREIYSGGFGELPEESHDGAPSVVE